MRLPVIKTEKVTSRFIDAGLSGVTHHNFSQVLTGEFNSLYSKYYNLSYKKLNNMQTEFTLTDVKHDWTLAKYVVNHQTSRDINRLVAEVFGFIHTVSKQIIKFNTYSKEVKVKILTDYPIVSINSKKELRVNSEHQLTSVLTNLKSVSGLVIPKEGNICREIVAFGLFAKKIRLSQDILLISVSPNNKLKIFSTKTGLELPPTDVRYTLYTAPRYSSLIEFIPFKTGSSSFLKELRKRQQNPQW